VERAAHFAHSRSARLALTAASGVLALALAVLAARYLAETSWPLSHGHRVLLVAAGLLLLVSYAFKAYGWRQANVWQQLPRRPFTLAG
jgi:hypothetical protein